MFEFGVFKALAEREREMKLIKAWVEYKVIEPKNLTAGGGPVKCEDGFVGFLPIWRTKKACKAAGHPTKDLLRCRISSPDSGQKGC